ncbi:MAG TPA: MBL fold metallo-hydrolase [Alphaproteobacteria bacterium]|jgi:phosphoribosyl 1,2-cyclic phosphodiesterase
MTLTFIGTRGYIDARTRRHGRHSALLVALRGERIMIDCGEDWRGRLRALRPNALLVTHAHPDHAGGLDRGAPCPVYATAETRRLAARYPISAWRIVKLRRPIRVSGFTVEAFRVAHSLRAPAVGYRISRGRTAFFYVPDVVAIAHRRAALRGVKLFVGDGATLTRPMVRRRGKALYGHTTIQAQLGWCRREGVARAVFTHCGSEIVAGNARRVGRRVRMMGKERGVNAQVAYDGLELVLA